MNIFKKKDLLVDAKRSDFLYISIENSELNFHGVEKINHMSPQYIYWR